MAFEAGRGGSGLEPKLAGLRLTPADFAGRRRRTPQDLGRILAGPGAGPSGPPVLGGPILDELPPTRPRRELRPLRLARGLLWAVQDSSRRLVLV